MYSDYLKTYIFQTLLVMFAPIHLNYNSSKLQFNKLDEIVTGVPYILKFDFIRNDWNLLSAFSIYFSELFTMIKINWGDIKLCFSIFTISFHSINPILTKFELSNIPKSSIFKPISFLLSLIMRTKVIQLNNKKPIHPTVLIKNTFLNTGETK